MITAQVFASVKQYTQLQNGIKPALRACARPIARRVDSQLPGKLPYKKTAFRDCEHREDLPQPFSGPFPFEIKAFDCQQRSVGMPTNAQA
jgi:hypothetical protein